MNILNSDQIEKLKKRWTNKKRDEVEEWIIEGQKGHPPCSKITINDHEYYDLRGLPNKAYFHDVNLHNIDFSYTEFDLGGLSPLLVSKCRFVHCNANGRLQGHFVKCDFSHMNCRGATLAGSSFIKCEMKSINFQKTGASFVFFYECDLSGAKMQNSVMGSTAIGESARFLQCKMHGAKFGGKFAQEMLSGVEFLNCNIDQAGIDWGGTDNSLARVAEIDY